MNSRQSHDSMTQSVDIAKFKSLVASCICTGMWLLRCASLLFLCKEFPSCFAHRILAPEKTVRWILEASDCPLLLSSLCRLPKVACKQGNPHLAANVVGKIGDLRAPEAFTQWAVNVDSYWCWIPHVQIAAVLWSVTILRPGDFLFDL